MGLQPDWSLGEYMNTESPILDLNAETVFGLGLLHGGALSDAGIWHDDANWKDAT